MRPDAAAPAWLWETIMARSASFGRVRRGLLILGLLVCTFSARAQDLPLVTALSSARAAEWIGEDGQSIPLVAGLPLSAGRHRIAPDARIMLYSPGTSAALIMLGPAEFDVQSTLDGSTEFQMLSGRLLVASAVPADETALHVVIPEAPGGAALASAYPARGWTYVAVAADETSIGFEQRDGGDGLLRVTVGAAEQEVSRGERLVLRDGDVQRTDLFPWAAEIGLAEKGVGSQIAIASARLTRETVEQRLFQRLVEWEYYGQPQQVSRRLEAEFRPELRTTLTTTTTTLRTQPQLVSRNTGLIVPGANQVPVLSPAAISVGGVTAVELNTQANRLLTLQGSRGLGFLGLSQLSIPGQIGGRRTIGPPGLGVSP